MGVVWPPAQVELEELSRSLAGRATDLETREKAVSERVSASPLTMLAFFKLFPPATVVRVLSTPQEAVLQMPAVVPIPGELNWRFGGRLDDSVSS
jgi:hypothetical protein